MDEVAVEYQTLLRDINTGEAALKRALVLANSEAIQNQRMHKQKCRYMIGLHPALG